MNVVVTSVLAFISTNIDDIFLILLLYAQAGGPSERRAILAGRYAGTGILLAISFLGVCGLQFISGRYLRLLGLIPIGLGVKAWINDRRKKEEEEERPAGKPIGLLAVTLITISAGGDNIGVYIPLFADYGLWELAVVTAVFAVMTAVWNYLGKRLADLPLIRQAIQRYKNRAVAVIFVLLGLYILFG